MAYNLIIDQGNSRAKVAVFQQREMVEQFYFNQLTAVDVTAIARRYPLTAAIYCSVANYGEEIMVALRKIATRVYELTSMLPLPISVGYATPASLGRDRMAAAAGAVAIFPGRKVLVVDAGTAVTYDMITAEGHFIGGSIAPGLWMRARALNTMTKRLPEVEAETNPDNLPMWADSTIQAIRNGVMRGVASEIIYHAEMAGPDTITILTGGDAHVLSRIIDPNAELPLGPKLKTEFIVDPDIVTKGLNSILLYNEPD
ncbi:MAG: type III pantothenate kinase [Muribaculum sp.]|nr:type III pantothenate kinase [Muribaculaceae bacterium]MCM1081214.1 type III pantothenate kinase [Muribaculum sp.]